MYPAAPLICAPTPVTLVSNHCCAACASSAKVARLSALGAVLHPSETNGTHANASAVTVQIDADVC